MISAFFYGALIASFFSDKTEMGPGLPPIPNWAFVAVAAALLALVALFCALANALRKKGKRQFRARSERVDVSGAADSAAEPEESTEELIKIEERDISPYSGKSETASEDSAEAKSSIVEAKEESKPEATQSSLEEKEETKPEAIQEAKAEAKDESKPDAMQAGLEEKEETKSDVTQESKPDATQEAKPEAIREELEEKEETKTEATQEELEEKTEATRDDLEEKEETKAEATRDEPEERQEAKPDATRETKTEAKEEAKPAAKPANIEEEQMKKSATKPKAKSEKKPEGKSPRPEETRAKKSAEKPKKAEPANAEGGAIGKFEICNSNLGGVTYVLRANNGQLLFESKEYRSAETCRDAISKFRDAVSAGMFSVRADKFKNFKFILKSPTSNNVIYMGESLASESSCKSNIESVKRFAQTAPIVDVAQTEYVTQYIAHEIPAEEIRAVESGEASPGKWEIGRVDEGAKNSPFQFLLFAANGQLLYESRDYKARASCLNGLKTFVETVRTGAFVVDPDKSGRFRFVLRNPASAVSAPHYGHSYDTKRACEGNIDAVYRCALTAPIPEK